jgi:hypothetical protein
MLSPFHTTRKSAPLSGGARCLLSGPLQPGIRLFRDPLPAAYSHTLRRAYATGPSGRDDNGFTEFHGDDTVGWVLPLYRRFQVSVSRNWGRTSDRLPFWLRRIKLFSPVSRDGSCGSSPMFTRPPSLAPYPPIAGRVQNRSSRIESAAYAGGTLSGRFRRPLTETAITHRLLMAEHQVGSASLTVKQADNHRRGFAPLRTPPSDSRRTQSSTLPMRAAGRKTRRYSPIAAWPTFASVQWPLITVVAVAISIILLVAVGSYYTFGVQEVRSLFMSRIKQRLTPPRCVCNCAGALRTWGGWWGFALRKMAGRVPADGRVTVDIRARAHSEGSPSFCWPPAMSRTAFIY